MVSSGGAFRAAAILVAILAALVAGPVGEAHGGSTATAAVRPAAVGTPVETDAWITAEAVYLSGRPLTVVCSANALEWARAVAAVGFTTGAGQEYYGFSLIRQGEMYLSPYVCGGLRLGHSSSIRRQRRPAGRMVGQRADPRVGPPGPLHHRRCADRGMCASRPSRRATPALPTSRIAPLSCLG